MSKTMLLAFGLALAACAPSADEEDSQPLSGRNNAPDAGPAEESCTARGDFDPAVFENEILPILEGAIDWNDPTGTENPTTGCNRGPCHGQPRPESFQLVGTPQEKLESFACFVDLHHPRRSQLLLCAANDDDCRIAPHPGAALLTGRGDRNYQRILGYIEDSRR